jgi:hypothetical protein
MSPEPIYDLGQGGGPPPKCVGMQLTLAEWKEAVKDKTRSRAIVTDALLEYALNMAIASQLSVKDEVWGHLVGDNGIGFAQKARLAYLLGAIRKGTMQDLLCIHRIRNTFAHVPSPQFSVDELIKEVQKLSTVGSKKRCVTKANYMDFYDKAARKCEAALLSEFHKALAEQTKASG